MNAQPPSLRRTLNMWEAVGVSVAIPVLGLALLGYTLYRNIIPWPAAARCGVRV
jgi:hypothetical protein